MTWTLKLWRGRSAQNPPQGSGGSSPRVRGVRRQRLWDRIEVL